MNYEKSVMFFFFYLKLLLIHNYSVHRIPYNVWKYTQPYGHIDMNIQNLLNLSGHSAIHIIKRRCDS